MPQQPGFVRATLFQKSLLPDLLDQDDPTNAGSSGRVALPVVAASVETPLNSRIADGVRLGGCHHVRSAFRRLVWTSLSPHTATNQPSPCFPAAVGCRRKINTSIYLHKQ
jgi:hypothetical protein